MSVKLLTKHLLEVLSLKEGSTGSPESTLIKMSNCWKSHAAGQLLFPTCDPSKYFKYKLTNSCLLYQYVSNKSIRMKRIKLLFVDLLRFEMTK